MAIDHINLHKNSFTFDKHRTHPPHIIKIDWAVILQKKSANAKKAAFMKIKVLWTTTTRLFVLVVVARAVRDQIKIQTA